MAPKMRQDDHSLLTTPPPRISSGFPIPLNHDSLNVKDSKKFPSPFIQSGNLATIFQETHNQAEKGLWLWTVLSIYYKDKIDALESIKNKVEMFKIHTILIHQITS
jgi:hypothetical protein